MDILGADHDRILDAMKVARGDWSSNLVGERKDLKSGDFADAAHGLPKFLKIPADFMEGPATVQQMEAEIHRLCDCPDCAKCQALVLEQLHRKEAELNGRLAQSLALLAKARKLNGRLAASTRAAAEAAQATSAPVRQGQKSVSRSDAREEKTSGTGLDEIDIDDVETTYTPSARDAKSLQSRSSISILARASISAEGSGAALDNSIESLQAQVAKIRREIADQGGWFYGCTNAQVLWPPETVKHSFGSFKQPLCDRCREYCLDFTTIFKGVNITVCVCVCVCVYVCVCVGLRVWVWARWCMCGGGGVYVCVCLSFCRSVQVWAPWMDVMGDVCRVILLCGGGGSDFEYIVRGEASEEIFHNGVRDKGRTGWRIADFMQTIEAIEANLTITELIALRFYTSHSFAAINIPLRDMNREDAHPFIIIVLLIQSGLKKLRAVGADKKESEAQNVVEFPYTYLRASLLCRSA